MDDSGPDDHTLDEYVIRVFGVTAADTVMRWPYRKIIRAAQIEGQRDAEARLARLRDISVADGMDQGRIYVDPKNPPEAGGAHYDLKPYLAHAEMLERAARPWYYTPQAVRERREREEDAMWEKTMQVLRGVGA